MIHTVKGFGVVNKADVFLELSCFFDDLPCQCGYKSSCSHIASRVFHHYGSVPGLVACCGCCICSVGRYEVFLCIYPCTEVGLAGKNSRSPGEVGVMMFLPAACPGVTHRLRDCSEEWKMQQGPGDLEPCRLSIAGRWWSQDLKPRLHVSRACIYSPGSHRLSLCSRIS